MVNPSDWALTEVRRFIVLNGLLRDVVAAVEDDPACAKEMLQSLIVLHARYIEEMEAVAERFEDEMKSSG